MTDSVSTRIDANSVRISAQDRCNVFVDRWELEERELGVGLFLAIHTRRGSANCILSQEQAQALLAALQGFFGRGDQA